MISTPAPACQHCDRDCPLPAGSCVVPSSGVADHGKDGEPDDDERGRSDLRAIDDLTRQEVSERQGEHDRRHEQRLDHGQLAVVERDRLTHVPTEESDRAQEPPGLADQPRERGRRAQRHLPHAERAFLLQGGSQREQERRTEREDVSHGAGV
jgi:hypothetical protein